MMVQEKIAPVEILLVEDNPVDVLMTQEACRSLRVVNNVHVTEDGEEALDFLYKRGKYAGVPSPEIILLDLNLPKKDGREVLTEIKGNVSLRHIPVIILTTSENHEDIWNSYHLHANCFITKPVGVEEFAKAMECLGEFWFTLARLPTRVKA